MKLKIHYENNSLRILSHTSMGENNKIINDLISKNGDGNYYREAADHVWELAKQYEELGLFELAGELKNIVSQIHALARARQKKQYPR